MIEHTKKQTTVRIFASDQGWIEGEAVRQLEKTANLAGMVAGVGLPDLHPGRGVPVGAAFFCKNMIYPYIVGNDVGCGIGLWQTSLPSGKVKRDKWAKKLKNLNCSWEGDLPGCLQDFGISPSVYDAALGTIGSGNHFAELQKVEKIHCQKTFEDLGMDKKRLQLLVHSGSRGIGESLLRNHTERFGADGLMADSKLAEAYLEKHDFGIAWARCNRALIARRFADQLGSETCKILDVCHNSVEKKELDGKTGLLHRKGAAVSDCGPLVIPGSRGTLSYLVEPTNDQSLNLWSLAHGAGRKWNRKSCRERIRDRCSPKSLVHTELGGVVICDDKELMFEEAPQAYKKIEEVIEGLETGGLIKVVATLRPVITYKRRSEL